MLTAPSEPSVAAIPVAAEKIILVAARDLKPGQKLTVDAVREASTPVALLSKGAFFSKDALFKPGEERILAVALAENEPILPTKFTNGVNADNGASGKVAAGMTPFNIRLNESSAVGAIVQADDWVDVLLTQTERAGEAATPLKASIVPVVRHVRVVATEPPASKRTASQPLKSVVVELNAEDVNKLTLSSNVGQLSVVLSPGSKDTKTGNVMDIDDVVRRPGVIKASQPSVKIIRLVEEQVYSVHSEAKK